MREVAFYGRRAIPNVFQIGVEMDNGVEQIQFILPAIIPNQVATLYLQNGDYADAVILTNGLWEVTHTTTQHGGAYDCYVTLTDGDTLLWHSEDFTATVYDLPNVEEQIEQEYPTAVQQAMNAAAQAIAANDNVQAAKTVTLAARDDAVTAANEAKEMQEQITQIEFAITNDMDLTVNVGWEVSP